MNNNTCSSAFPGKCVSRLFLCLCPVVAGATCGVNGLTLGVLMLFILLLSGLVLTALKKILPENAYIPSVFVITALFTGIAWMLLNIVSPLLADELGVFVPLCGLGGMIGLLARGDKCLAGGSLCAGCNAVVFLTLVGVIRELLGYGRLFGKILWVCGNGGLLVARYPASAFILLGVLAGIVSAIRGHGKEEA